MILVADVGNTNVCIGVYGKNGEQISSFRLATNLSLTEDQYALEISGILKMRGIKTSDFNLAALSCVVPPLSSVMKNALAIIGKCRVISIGPGVKSGLDIRIEDPAVLGADLVCGAVAAINKYGAPCIVVDLGTATKISAIDSRARYLGCSISPGIGISLSALSFNTAQLPHIDLSSAKDLIGVNSVGSMLSGIVFGTACMMDGMIKRYRDILGQNTTVVSTGGYSGVITPQCETKIINDPSLILDGLCSIAIKNKK